MTNKLYEADSLQTTCTALVLSCTQAGEGWLAELSDTVLFAEGGGQLSDVGTVGEAVVSHVREREGVVLHLCDRPLTVGERYTVMLDWDTRLDHMQQHTGEHILSYALWSLFDANNVGFRMSGSHQVTIDMDRELTPEELTEAEDLANRQIWEDRPIDVFLAEGEELDRLPLRKRTDKVLGALRVVRVQGGDCCTCCGTHLPRTGMVGSIRILRQERYKGGVRIAFLCGRWALEDARQRNALTLELAASFSAKPEELPERLKKLREETASLGARLRTRTAALWEQKASRLLAEARKGCVAAGEENITPAEAKLLLQALTAQPGVTAAVVYSDGERVSYLLGKSAGGRGDCGFLCQLANGLFNGKGGGKESFAQGSGNYAPDWRERVQALLTAMER